MIPLLQNPYVNKSAPAIILPVKQQNVGTGRSFVSIIVIVLRTFLLRAFKFTAEIARKFPDVSRHSAQWTKRVCINTAVILKRTSVADKVDKE